MRKEYKVLIATGIFFGLVFLTIFLSGLREPHEAISPQKTQTGTYDVFNLRDLEVEDVLNFILNGYEHWTTIQGEATVVWYMNGETQTYSTGFAFQQPGKAMTMSTDAPSFIENGVWISDGEFTYDINLNQGTYSQEPLPAFAYDTSRIPKSLSETSDLFLYNHPLALLTPSIVTQYIFPQWLVAQGIQDTQYEIIGEEKILGRETWIMTWIYTTSHITVWVDQETGVILKFMHKIDGSLWQDFQIDSILFDEEIPEDTFTVPENFTLVDNEPHQPPIIQNAEVEYVFNFMLHSHEHWKTIQGEATVVWYTPLNVQTQTYSTKFAFQLPGKAMVTLTEAPSFIEKSAWISDGEFTYEINLEQKTYSQNKLLAFVYDTSLIPNSLSEASDIYMYHHPFALLTPSLVAEQIFPHWFAQGSADATYELIGEEKILGRDTWVMEETIRSSHITAWVDQETGVILKYIAEKDGTLWEDFKMNSVLFDAEIPEETFALPGDLTQVDKDY
jgi:outer membrane lipoprotein-sorting protein